MQYLFKYSISNMLVKTGTIYVCLVVKNFTSLINVHFQTDRSISILQLPSTVMQLSNAITIHLWTCDISCISTIIRQLYYLNSEFFNLINQIMSFLSSTSSTSRWIAFLSPTKLNLNCCTRYNNNFLDIFSYFYKQMHLRCVDMLLQVRDRAWFVRLYGEIIPEL